MNDTWQVLGLPLHPLLVHAVVVLLPLAVLAVVLVQLWPAARRRIGVVAPLGALVVAVLVPVTVGAGLSLADAVGRAPAVQTHEGYGLMLIPWSIALPVVAWAQWAWFRRGRGREADGERGNERAGDDGPGRGHPVGRAAPSGAPSSGASRRARSRGAAATSALLGLAVAVVVVGSMTVLALTGDSGARAVWGGLLG